MFQAVSRKTKYAGMAELADALDSGRVTLVKRLNDLTQVPPRRAAPSKNER